MSNRQDMYIDYKHSNRKRKRKRNNNYKFWIIFCCILLAAGLGYTGYALVGPELFHSKGDNQVKAGTDNQEITPILPTVGITPTAMPTVMPTINPTVMPTQEVTVTLEPDTIETTALNPETVKGIYVPARSAASDKIDELISIAEDTEINAMVIDIKDDQGRISYAMDCALAKEIGADTDTISDMPSLIQKLKSKNIYLIARIVAFKDPFLAEKRPDFAIKNKDGTTYVDGNGEAWVNPYMNEVWDYLVDVASQAAAIGFDEIQFDYIRFSTSKAIAQADFGEGSAGVSKEEIITDFTKYAYEKLKPLGVYVSADVYGTIIASAVDAGSVGQNYMEMSKYLDYICPMIYPSHFGEGNFGIKYPDTEPYEIISKVLSLSVEKLKGIQGDEQHAIVRPWLQDFTATWIDHHIKYGGDEIREQIEGVYSAGYQEWILWNASSNYSEDGLVEE